MKFHTSLEDLTWEERTARLDAVLMCTAIQYPCPQDMNRDYYWVIFLYNIQFFGYRKTTEKMENDPYSNEQPRKMSDSLWQYFLKKEGLSPNPRKKKKNAKFVFMTISHSSNQNLETIQRYHKSLISKKICKLSDYYYSIEQRGETLATLGDGLHTHIIIKILPQFRKNGNYQKSRLIKETSNTFKIQKNYVDVKFLYSQEDFLRVLNYISGNKKEQHKKEKVKMDILFRQNKNLDKLYSNASKTPSY